MKSNIAKIRQTIKVAQSNPTYSKMDSDSVDYILTKHYVLKKKVSGIDIHQK